ncbi:MAG: class I SAM-dependent methyltransferase [Deltaproteobacteria bacterium]
MSGDSFSYTGTELDALSQAQNYHAWIYGYFAGYFGRRVIEVGAGIGTFSEFILAGEGVSELTLFEPAENLFPKLQARFRTSARVRAIHGKFDAPALSADSIVLVNVLEHIEKDELFLESAYSTLAPGGRILLFVPALPWIYGTLDEAVEHFRRYTKPSLCSKLKGAGFQIETARYFNLPGALSWFIAGRALKKKTISPSDVWFYDKWVVPWVSRLERLIEPPLGQSLIAVARKSG